MPAATGTPSSVQSASAARTNRRAAAGASGFPGRDVRTTGGGPGRATGWAEARKVVSRCIGMAPTVLLLSSSDEYASGDTDRVTD
ncbi:hypothetical protein GCM10010252_12910 [Streptomyces aureoverticillatus]|nr:hypothetical protein GCM10010252_12910 [Streptomyces aureoverticillatus]